MTKIKLPKEVVSIIYHCHQCGGKHTFGRDYFEELDIPELCPGCGTPFIQEDRYSRLEADTSEDLDAKKRDLLRKRGVLPDEPKPQDPNEIKERRMRALRDELARLESIEVNEDK